MVVEQGETRESFTVSSEKPMQEEATSSTPGEGPSLGSVPLSTNRSSRRRAVGPSVVQPKVLTKQSTEPVEGNNLFSPIEDDSHVCPAVPEFGVYRSHLLTSM